MASVLEQIDRQAYDYFDAFGEHPKFVVMDVTTYMDYKSEIRAGDLEEPTRHGSLFIAIVHDDEYWGFKVC